jgi:hypothetical protein
LRLAAVAGAVFGLYALYGLLTTYVDALRAGEASGFHNVSRVVDVLFVVIRGVLGLMLCWFNWKLAGALVATAGGTTGSMHEWSQIQWNLARLVVATLGVNFAAMGWEWLHYYLLQMRILPINF